MTRTQLAIIGALGLVGPMRHRDIVRALGRPVWWNVYADLVRLERGGFIVSGWGAARAGTSTRLYWLNPDGSPEVKVRVPDERAIWREGGDAQ